jgi:pilus assembly protein CpaE
LYPFQAIIVGGSETERSTIRGAVTNLSVTVGYEYDNIDKAIGQRAPLADLSCFFLIKVNSIANMDQLARLSQVFVGKPIVALLNEDSDLSAVLNIQRAGAAQVLLLPFKPEQLRAVLDTISRQFGCPTTNSRVIAVLGASEGCGSTSLAINLSDAFSNIQKQSCVLVELSLRLGRIATYLNIEPTITVSDLLAGNNILEVNVINQALIRVSDRFQLLVGPNRSVDQRPISSTRVLSLIGSVRQMAEVVVLDMPYTFDDLYFDVLSVADQVVLVARPNPPSLQALKVVSEAVAQRALGASQHLAINCFGPRAKDFTEIQLCKALATEQIWTIASDPNAFEAAVDSGRPLHEGTPRSPAWSGIMALASKLTGVREPISPKQKAFLPSWVTDLFRKVPPVRDPTIVAQ